MAKNWVGRWRGGRIAENEDGRRVFYVERMIDKIRYSFPLDPLKVQIPGDAEDELIQLKRNPAAYMARRKEAARGIPADGIGVDVEHVKQFLEHLKAAGCTLEYRQNVHHYLGRWLTWFAGRPFANVTPADLAHALREWKTAKRHRTISLKSYASFLREEIHVLNPKDDPTTSIKIPTARAEKSVRAKGHTMEHVALVYRHIEQQDVRDVICLRATTGMHETEASRVAMGKAIIREVDALSEIAAVIHFRHKNGDVHHQSIGAQALAAARRLIAGHQPEKGKKPRRLDNKRQHREIEKAAIAATKAIRKTVLPIQPGELRHSFVTWARTHGREVRIASNGVGMDRIAETIGHKSNRTTSKFYDGTEVPPMIVVPIRLEHPDDPPIPVAGQT